MRRSVGGRGSLWRGWGRRCEGGLVLRRGLGLGPKSSLGRRTWGAGAWRLLGGDSRSGGSVAKRLFRRILRQRAYLVGVRSICRIPAESGLLQLTLGGGNDEKGGGSADGVGGAGWGAGAVKGVGFGPQIKFGATDLGGLVLCSARYPRRSAGMTDPGRMGLGAALGEIPAAERGYDRSWWDGALVLHSGRYPRRSAGMTVPGGMGRWCCVGGWVWAPNQVWGDGPGGWSDAGAVSRRARGGDVRVWGDASV